MLGDIILVVASCDTFIIIAITADTTATIIGGIATVAAIISIIAAASGMVRRESIANIVKSGILGILASGISGVGIKKNSLTFSRLLKAT